MAVRVKLARAKDATRCFISLFKFYEQNTGPGIYSIVRISKHHWACNSLSLYCIKYLARCWLWPYGSEPSMKGIRPEFCRKLSSSDSRSSLKSPLTFRRWTSSSVYLGGLLATAQVLRWCTIPRGIEVEWWPMCSLNSISLQLMVKKFTLTFTSLDRTVADLYDIYAQYSPSTTSHTISTKSSGILSISSLSPFCQRTEPTCDNSMPTRCQLRVICPITAGLNRFPSPRMSFMRCSTSLKYPLFLLKMIPANTVNINTRLGLLEWYTHSQPNSRSVSFDLWEEMALWVLVRLIVGEGGSP